MYHKREGWVVLYTGLHGILDFVVVLIPGILSLRLLLPIFEVLVYYLSFGLYWVGTVKVKGLRAALILDMSLVGLVFQKCNLFISGLIHSVYLMGLVCK